MSFLSFQPAFDVFHTEFRFLRLRRLMEASNPWHFDQLRIADFYLTFFFRLQHARLSPKHTPYRTMSRRSSKPRYENQPDDQILFARMQPIQKAALSTLITAGFFDAESFSRELVVETDIAEPPLLAARIDALNSDEAPLVEAIQAITTEYDLLGPDGLKARTRLLEFKYDKV